MKPVSYFGARNPRMQANGNEPRTGLSQTNRSQKPRETANQLLAGCRGQEGSTGDQHHQAETQ